LIAPSQGIHLVFDHSFLSADSAINGASHLGRPGDVRDSRGTATRSSAPPTHRLATPTLEPRPLEEEIEFILETAGQYLLKPPTRADG
jgi:Glycerol-3-phosphate dehydrogenase